MLALSRFGRRFAKACRRTARRAVHHDRDYSRGLPAYLRDLAERAYQSRNRAISSLTTPAAIRKRQQWVTETFWSLIGGMPDRTPLNARTVGSFERPKYRVEKVVYESQPNFHISGTLYIPDRGAPAVSGSAVPDGPHDQRKGRRHLSSLLPDAGGRRLSGAGIRPDGQGEGRNDHPGRVPSAAGSARMRNIPSPAVRCCSRAPPAPGCRPGTRCAAWTIWRPSDWWTQAAGCDRPIRRRHRHHVSGGSG